MDWIPVETRMPSETDSLFAKLKGTHRYVERTMWEKQSCIVLVTIEHKGQRFVCAGRTIDGKWKNDYLRIYRDAKVVAWLPFPDPF